MFPSQYEEYIPTKALNPNERAPISSHDVGAFGDQQQQSMVRQLDVD
jgi:hypothetical protein